MNKADKHVYVAGVSAVSFTVLVKILFTIRLDAVWCVSYKLLVFPFLAL
jgi:hypothetical protein